MRNKINNNNKQYIYQIISLVPFKYKSNTFQRTNREIKYYNNITIIKFELIKVYIKT